MTQPTPFRKNAVYLDANAASPLKREVVHGLISYLGFESPFRVESQSSWLLANPSSVHFAGRTVKRLVRQAREKVAASLGVGINSEQLVFTSSGTESNQTVIRGILERRLRMGEKAHWITSPIEHPSVLGLVPWFESQGGEVSYVPVTPQGNWDVAALSTLLRPQTALVSLIWVNNETGVIQPVNELRKWVNQPNTLIHIDGAQAWGKIPIQLNDVHADFVTFSAYKIGALSGNGVIWARDFKPMNSLLTGSQQNSHRGGTENVLGILSIGLATESIDPKGWADRVRPVRDRIETEILKKIDGVIVHGAKAERVANTLSLAIERVDSPGLVMALDLEGFAISGGSACSAGTLTPSHVILAQGCSESIARSTIRISLPDAIPLDVTHQFVETLASVVQRLRSQG